MDECIICKTQINTDADIEIEDGWICSVCVETIVLAKRTKEYAEKEARR